MLFGLEELLSKKARKQWHNSLISEEKVVFLQEQTAGLERLELALQLRYANYAGDELDIVCL